MNNNDFIIILVGRIVYVLLTVLSIRIMSTTLSESEIGNYYLIIAFIFFFTSGLISPFGSYISRNINLWKQNKNILNTLFIYASYSFFISLISLAIVYIVFNTLNYSVSFESIQLYLYIFLSVFIGNTHYTILGLANIIGLRKFYIKYLILTMLIGLCFAIILSYLSEPSALNWLFGFLFAEIILILLVVIRLNIIIGDSFNITKIKLKFSKYNISKVFFYSSPLLIVCILSWAQNYSYRFIIEYKYGLEVLALVGLGFSIASSIMAAFESIIAQYINPIFYQKITLADKIERENAFKQNINVALPIYILVAFFIMGLAPYLIKILIAQKFYYAYVYLIIGAWIELFKVSINHGKLIFHSEYKNKLIILPSMISAIISLIALYYTDLGSRYYIIGFILLASFFLYISLIAVNIKRIVKIKIFDIKRIIISVCFGTIFLTALYFNNANDYNIFNNLKVLFIYGLVFIVLITKFINMTNKNHSVSALKTKSNYKKI